MLDKLHYFYGNYNAIYKEIMACEEVSTRFAVKTVHIPAILVYDQHFVVFSKSILNDSCRHHVA
jgi:hypothetical protein